MALSKAIQDALNDHINQEFHSSYLYLSMSAYYDSINLPGFAHWMRVQSQEEYEHTMNLFDFVNDREGRVMLQSISQTDVGVSVASGSNATSSGARMPG